MSATITDLEHSRRRAEARRIPITSDRLHQVLNYDPETGVFTWREGNHNQARAGSVAGALRGMKAGGHRQIYIGRKVYRAHRLAWLYVHGVWPVGEIDHINCNPDDNRIANLRIADRSQNIANSRRSKSNKSGFKGASFDPRRQKWRARVRKGGREHWLGYFDTPEAAHAAYCAGAAIHHGEYARAS